MPRLKYVGQQPTTFRDAQLESGALVRIGHVLPGDEFGVPDEVAESFLRRADIELAQDDAPPQDAKPAKARAKAEPDPAAEAPADAAGA